MANERDCGTLNCIEVHFTAGSLTATVLYLLHCTWTTRTQKICNTILSADDGLHVQCMQISAANSRAAFESRASKFLVKNRTLSYSVHVSGTRNIRYQNEWHMHEQSYYGTSFWYRKLGRRTWGVCHIRLKGVTTNSAMHKTITCRGSRPSRYPTKAGNL